MPQVAVAEKCTATTLMNVWTIWRKSAFDVALVLMGENR
jgi:hypothetical protein